MSTIKVDTIKNTSNVEVFTVKAWVNFDGTGSPSIRASQLTALNQHGSSAAVELTVEVRKPEPRLDGLVDPTPVVISRPD